MVAFRILINVNKTTREFYLQSPQKKKVIIECKYAMTSTTPSQYYKDKLHPSPPICIVIESNIARHNSEKVILGVGVGDMRQEGAQKTEFVYTNIYEGIIHLMCVFIM